MAQSVKKLAPMGVGNTGIKKEETPVTTVKGKVVQVTGTKGGAISSAQQGAKMARLKGTEAPNTVAGYKSNQLIKHLTPEEATLPRPGTYRAKAFAAVKGCKNVGEYALTGFKTKYLARWARMGFIRIV